MSCGEVTRAATSDGGGDAPADAPAEGGSGDTPPPPAAPSSSDGGGSEGSSCWKRISLPIGWRRSQPPWSAPPNVAAAVSLRLTRSSEMET